MTPWKQQMTPDQRARKIARQRERRAERKQLGLCVSCPDPAEAGRASCRACLDEDNVARSYRTASVRPRSARKKRVTRVPPQQYVSPYARGRWAS